MAAKKTGSAAMDYIVSRLKRNPNVTYAEVKDGAEAQKLTVHPIMYGRGKLLLGMVKAGAGRSKKAAKKAGKRGPGRPRKVGRPAGPRSRGAAGAPLDAIRALMSDMQARDRDNEQLRATLEKVRSLIAAVL